GCLAHQQGGGGAVRCLDRQAVPDARHVDGDCEVAVIVQGNGVGVGRLDRHRATPLAGVDLQAPPTQVVVQLAVGQQPVDCQVVEDRQTVVAGAADVQH